MNVWAVRGNTRKRPLLLGGRHREVAVNFMQRVAGQNIRKIHVA